MICYDTEAPNYDETRGGAARADAAATAIRALLPADARTVLDVAGGTGIVGSRLGRTVFSVDRSIGMSRVAATRMPGRVVLGNGTALPIASGAVDAVTTIWLLHLLNPEVSAEVIVEIGRVLRPGGTWLTTVNKSSDDPGVTDDRNRVVRLAGEQDMSTTGSTTFVGVGQPGEPVYRLVAFTRARSACPTA